MRQVPESAWRRRWVILTLGAILAGQLLLAGCSSLCNKRLYLNRETPEKMGPASSLALIIADPDLANAVFAASSRYPRGGCQWAPEQPSYESVYYRLSIDALDGKGVYQGQCLDTLPTYACEVRPGARRLSLRLNIFGPEGLESLKEVARLDLEPGGVYFLQPDCEALGGKHFRLKWERLPEPYTTELRGRLLDWKRKNTKGTYTGE